MSHQIQNAVFSAQEGAGWTGLGQVIPAEEARDPAAIAARCKALYAIEQRPVFIKKADGSFGEIPGRLALVRNDNDYVTGIASDERYNVEFRQPKDVFEAFRDQLAAEKLTISHAAVLARGARIAVCAILPPDHSFSVGDAQDNDGQPLDRVDQYLTLSTGYDTKHGTRRTTGSIRVVCANTLAMSVDEALRAKKMKSISASQKLEANSLAKLVNGAAIGEDETLAQIVERTAKAAKTQKALFDSMANHRVSAVDLVRFFGDVLEIDIAQLNHVKPDGRQVISTKSRNMLSALSAAYDTAPGSKWAHGSVWGALNAVTYFATHAKTCRDTSGSGAGAARYASNLDGDAAALKARALVLANSLVQVAA